MLYVIYFKQRLLARTTHVQLQNEVPGSYFDKASVIYIVPSQKELTQTQHTTYSSTGCCSFGIVITSENLIQIFEPCLEDLQEFEF